MIFSYRCIKYSLLFILFPSFLQGIYSQNIVSKKNVQLDWQLIDTYIRYSDEEPTPVWTSKQTDFHGKHPSMPYFNRSVRISGDGELKVQINAIATSTVEINKEDEKHLTSDWQVEVYAYQSRNQWFASLSLLPFKYENGNVIRIDAFEWVISSTPKARSTKRNPPPTFESVLSTGDIFKIAVEESGIYKITRDQLNDIGINAASIDPRNLSLYGNGGAKLNEMLNEERIDDLAENPILITGEEDGSFDSEDAIYFYGEGPDVWKTSAEGVNYIENPYANANYYYLKVTNERGLRIGEASVPSNVERTISYYDDYQRYENDRINLMGDFALTEGTGQEWYGEYFNSVRTQSFESQFDFDNVIRLEPVALSARFAVRSKSTSRIELQFDESTFSNSVARVNGDADRPYAINSSFNEQVFLNSDDPALVVRYPSNGDISEAWLDFIELRMRKQFSFDKPSFVFRDAGSKDVETASFNVDFPSSYKVWNITNPIFPVSMSTENGLTYTSNNIEQTFIAWNEQSVKSVQALGRIENQNLHAISDVDMIVIYYKDFKAAAERFAAHRAQESKLRIEVVDIDQVSEEFGSGKKDPSALRNFLKMIYDRTDNFRFLLLVGDASYDFRHLDKQLEDQNFVPTYETIPSLDPIDNFPTDDYFALLSDDEGGSLRGGLDIAVGRLPVKTAQEADDVVNKLISYEENKFGDWRLRLGWAADDEDNSTHFNQSDDIQTDVEEKYPSMNHRMTYFDAFPQESTPGGARYPEATNSLNENIFNGLLVLNYLGHGGPRGWAQERVLQIADIQQWDNPDKLPLLITATCTFTGFDDPALVSGGEECILKDDGGVVALMTTVRPVFSQDNKTLVSAVFDTLLSRVDGEQPRFGDVMVKSKNRLSGSIEENARKFVLIGDPSQKLAVPLNNIVVSSINGVDADNPSQDTLNALELVTVEGYIADANNQLIEDFNGTVFSSIFDKKNTLKLLVNDPGRSRPGEFEVYSNTLFKGSATVTNGRFSFSFVVPTDINYTIGKGRISLYAENGQEDAAGYNNNILIGGGGSGNVSDNVGPQIELFMNDESFVYGGITDMNPILLAKLSDDIGINVTGSSIGHDLTAVLDNNTQQTYVLNDFYEADKDSYQQGTVRFPLTDIAPGKHTLTFKAWDTNNNSSEEILEFTVVDKDNTSLEHVFNYPNPFTDRTAFQFEHDLSGSTLDVLIQIYTVSGKLIKTIQESKISDGYRVDDIFWDGRDDFGSKIGKGVYLYKIKVNAQELNESRESDFGKLVIMK
jgi:hypothetical protein